MKCQLKNLATCRTAKREMKIPVATSYEMENLRDGWQPSIFYRISSVRLKFSHIFFLYISLIYAKFLRKRNNYRRVCVCVCVKDGSIFSNLNSLYLQNLRRSILTKEQ